MVKMDALRGKTYHTNYTAYYCTKVVYCSIMHTARTTRLGSEEQRLKCLKPYIYIYVFYL